MHGVEEILHPDVLIGRAEQSVRARRHIGLFLGCPEEYVEAHLAETLLDALSRMPVFAGLRREKDRIVARSIALLLGEVVPNDPLRPRIRECLSRLVCHSDLLREAPRI